MFPEIQSTVSRLASVNASAAPAQRESTVPAVAEAIQAPKVQLPKPTDIKVDTEKLQANLKAAIEQFNKVMSDGGRNLSFSIDSQLGGPVVTVKNAQTGEVVRQLPNEVVVRVAHNIEEFKGLLHNQLT